MSSDGDNQQPAARTSPYHYREPRTFTGKPGDDVDEWLSHYQRVSRSNGWNAASQLSHVGLFLDFTALVWFENHEDTLTTWDQFVEEIKKCFGDPATKKKRAEQTLSQRAQVTGETCRTYIEEILKLCKSVDAHMTEEDKVGHILKGIADDVYHFLIGKESLECVADVINHCRTFEALKTRRITSKFGRLANVTTVATVDVCQNSLPADLSSTIRQIVREELRRHVSVPMQAGDPQCDTLSPSINAASFDERSYSTRSPRLRAPPPQATYVESSYAPRSSYSYDSQPPPFVSEWQQFPEHPLHTAAFNVPRERPVCYQCGVRGHIARFCPSRRRPRTTFSDRPAMLARRSQQPDYAYWPSDSTAQKHGHRPNIRSDSPASVRSLTPPTTRQRRSPSPRPRPRLSSPPPGN